MIQSTSLLLPTPRHDIYQENGGVQGLSRSSQTQEDTLMAERVECALHATGYRPLRGLEVAVNGRFVHLEGRVPTYHLKQLAQATAMAVPGVRYVHNDLDVQTTSPQTPLERDVANGVGPGAHQPRRKWLGVLVVDDEPLMRFMLQSALERHGFGVWLASNGYEAIDRYHESHEKIDVVLLDVRMPGLDGPETLDALREINPRLQACFMSGDTGGYQPETLIQRGVSRVITKPFLLDDLANILRELAWGNSAGLRTPHPISQG